MIAPETIVAFSTKFPAARWSEFAAQHRAVVPRESLAEAFAFARSELGFDLLVDLTCVDYLNYREAEDRLVDLDPVLPAVLVNHFPLLVDPTRVLRRTSLTCGPLHPKCS